MNELILNDIRSYFKNKYNIVEKEIKYTTAISYNANQQTENSVILSSIEYVEFIVYIEEKYNIIYDFDVNIDTVEKIIQYVIEHNNDIDYALNI